jgi:hypothetical protein
MMMHRVPALSPDYLVTTRLLPAFLGYYRPGGEKISSRPGVIFMINATDEHVLTLAQAANELPRRSRGRKTSTSTLYRWSTAGCRGVRLETIQIGGSRCTSRQALQRFFDSLTPDRCGRTVHVINRVPDSKVRTAAQRQRAAEQAERELLRLGA